MKIYIFFSVAFFSVFSLFAGKSITVDPAESAIILPVKADNIK